jgi:hypothetical protein
MERLFENYQDYVEAYENLNETRVPKSFLKKTLIRGKAGLRAGVNKFKGSNVGKHVIANKTAYAAGGAALGAGAIGVAGGRKSAAKKRLNEAVEWGVSPSQFVYDMNVLRELKDMSESDRSIDYGQSRNTYFAEQRDIAIDNGFEDAAEYYDAQIR